MASIYDFKKVNLIIDGRYVTDFFEGTEITLSRNADTYNKSIGVKGEVSYAKNNDKSNALTFTLSNNSPSNKWLREYADRGAFIPVSCVDGNIGSEISIHVNDCVIMKPADIVRGLNIAGQEWTIDIPEF